MSANRRLAIGALVLALGGAAFVALRPRQVADAPAPPPVEIVKEGASDLQNGVHVDWVACESCKTVALALRVGVGAEHDPEERSGLAFVLEQLLAPDAGDASKRSLAVGAESTIYSATFAKDHLAAELLHAANVLSNLEVDDASLKKARDEVASEIARRKGDDAMATAIGFAQESAHASRAKGYLGGVAEDVEKITREDVEAHWKAYFKGDNARLALVGKVDPGSVTTLVQNVFGRVPRGEKAKLGPAPGAGVTGTLVMGREPEALALAVAAPEPRDVTFPAFLVLATRLADNAGAWWRFEYDPLAAPGTLLLSGALSGGERPEPAADRLRKTIDAAITPPLSPADAGAVQARFGALLGTAPLDPALCKKDPLGVALGRAGRAPLGIDAAALSKALSSLTDARLDEARALFAPKRTSAVGAGGPIQ